VDNSDDAIRARWRASLHFDRVRDHSMQHRAIRFRKRVGRFLRTGRPWGERLALARCAD